MYMMQSNQDWSVIHSDIYLTVEPHQLEDEIKVNPIS